MARAEKYLTGFFQQHGEMSLAFFSKRKAKFYYSCVREVNL